MKEQLVTFETADMAEKCGFNVNCDWSINDKNETHFLVFEFYPNNSEFVFNPEDDPEVIEYEKFLKTLKRAPTQSLLQKWLRETHKLHINLSLNQFGYGFMYAIIDMEKLDYTTPLKGGVNYKWSYEEALEEGLKQSLLILKQRKDG